MKGDDRFNEIELFYYLYIRNKELSPCKSMKTLNGSNKVENLPHHQKKIIGEENFDLAFFRLWASVLAIDRRKCLRICQNATDQLLTQRYPQPSSSFPL